MCDFNNRDLFLTSKLLNQGYRNHKLRKAFSRFYHRHSEVIVEYNIGLKTPLQQGISEPIFYGDLVYKSKRIVGKPNFSAVVSSKAVGLLLSIHCFMYLILFVVCVLLCISLCPF